MLYPVKLTTIQDQLTIYIPDPEQLKPVYEKLLITDTATAFPFWAKIWASSIALTSLLKNELHLIKGKRMLEIGAGIGIPSFAVAHAAESIIVSDHAAEAVELMQINIQHLGLSNAQAMCLDWNLFPEEIEADVLLLSDINYAPEQFDALLKLIQRFLQQGSTIIIATPQRIMAVPFVEKLEPYRILSSIETVIENDQSTEICILILSV